MNKVVLIGVALVIITGIWYLGSRETKPVGKESELESEIQEEQEETVSQIGVDILEQNNSGQSGSATLIQEGSQTRVTLVLEGGKGDAPQPAHIHRGTCAELKEIVYELSNVADSETGMRSSDTVINASFQEVRGALPLAINVHRSAEELSEYVACGEIVVP